MKLSDPYKELFSIDVSKIKELVDKISDDEWNSWDLRQKKYSNHSKTKSYPLMFWDNLDNFKIEKDICKVHIFNKSSPLWNVIENVYKKLEEFYNGVCINMIIVKLLPKSIIHHHKDSGDLLRICHRCHIPLKTNKNVLFFIKNCDFNFEEGLVYEISNLDTHCVKNYSDEDRIHLIIDIVEKNVNLPIQFYQ